MRKYTLVVVILTLTLFAQEKENESFITPAEYGKHLYENPRGIGCIKCHGKRGEGAIIAKYEDQGKKRVLKTEEIISITYVDFLAAMKSPKSVMSKYFLTPSELRTLYNYIVGSVE